MSTTTADLCGHRWPFSPPTNPMNLVSGHYCTQPANHPTTVRCRCRCGATTTEGDQTMSYSYCEAHPEHCNNGGRPRVVVLCGSTRFYDQYQQANYDETMAGRIVLSVGFYPHAKAEHGHGEGVGHDSAEKVALDELHKRKIDLADEVLVVSDESGYIGESTRSEIEYARKLNRPIRYRRMTADGGHPMTATPSDQPSTPAAALRRALEVVKELTRDTDGNDLHPDANIPVGEIQRVLAEAAEAWADELDAAPATYQLPAEPPADVTELWDFGGCRWDRAPVIGTAAWRWSVPGRRMPGHRHPDHPEPLLRSWYGLLALGPLSTAPPTDAEEATDADH